MIVNDQEEDNDAVERLIIVDRMTSEIELFFLRLLAVAVLCGKHPARPSFISESDDDCLISGHVV